MISTNSFKRGNYNYTHYLGTNAGGNSVDYIDRTELDEVEGLPIRYFPEEVKIKRNTTDGKGAVEYIETTYLKCLINPLGKPVDGAKTAERITFRTNDADILFFIAGLGLSIMKSATNGFFRSPMGFNNLKVYDSINGNLLSYTTEQINLPPTFDYYD